MLGGFLSITDSKEKGGHLYSHLASAHWNGWAPLPLSFQQIAVSSPAHLTAQSVMMAHPLGHSPFSQVQQLLHVVGSHGSCQCLLVTAVCLCRASSRSDCWPFCGLFCIAAAEPRSESEERAGCSYSRAPTQSPDQRSFMQSSGWVNV